MKIKDKVKSVVTGLAFGMKRTEDMTLKQIGESKADDTSTHQEMNSQSLADALLKGEVTQEVKELRYRTYEVDRESKKYEYFSPTLAKKIDKFESNLIEYENSDDLNVMVIQPNVRKTESVADGLKNAELKNGNYLFTEPKKRYNIKIERDFCPRFRIEEYVSRVVVFDGKDHDGRNVVVDLYTSAYPLPNDPMTKSFISETKSIMNRGKRSDVIEFKGMSFVTDNAYLADDMKLYEFSDFALERIIEYDGHYIYRFACVMTNGGEDLTEQFYDEGMAEKYRNKEKKEMTLDLTNDFRKSYVCEGCGKVIYYDPSLLDNIDAVSPKFADDDADTDANATEYMDIQIAEQTYGKRLCKDCLKKYLSEMKQINELK